MYFINSICTMWPSCESFVTALPSPLDGPSPSHLGPGSTARIQSGFFHPSQQRKGNLHSVTQSEISLVQAKVGVQGSWGVAVLKNGGGASKCAFVCVRGVLPAQLSLGAGIPAGYSGPVCAAVEMGPLRPESMDAHWSRLCWSRLCCPQRCGTQGASVDCHMHPTI